MSSKTNTSYLKALCCSEALFADGFVQAIHHGQSEKYYSAILDGQDTGLLPEVAEPTRPIEDKAADAIPQLEMDVEGIVPAIANASWDDPLRQIEREKTQEEHEDMSDSQAESSSVIFAGESEDDDGYSPSLARAEDLEARVMQLDNDDASGGNDPPIASASLNDPQHEIAVAAPPPPAPPAEVSEGSALQALKRKPRSGAVRAAAEAHPDSFLWGPFRFTFTGPEKRPPSGQWQASCPFHRLSEKTGCARATQVGSSAESKEAAKRKLQTWCLTAPLYDRKRRRTSAQVQAADVLPQELLDAKILEMEPPAGKPPTDEELDSKEKQDIKKGTGGRKRRQKQNRGYPRL